MYCWGSISTGLIKNVFRLIRYQINGYTLSVVPNDFVPCPYMVFL